MTPFPETRISLILRLATPADVDAWEEFTAVYGPAVYQLARDRGLQPADAEDIAQEILFAVARSVQRFEPDASRAKFRTWLSRIARNRLADFWAGGAKRPLTQPPSDSWLESISSHPNNSEQFDTAYRQAVFQLAATRVRERTSLRNWQAFAATTLQQQPIGQVADALEMQVGTLYVTRCRILKQLRDEVQAIDARLQNESLSFDDSPFPVISGSESP